MSDFEDGMAVGLAIGRKKFSGGNGGGTPTEEKWEYPSNWLTLPEPAENQIVLLADSKNYAGNDTYNVQLLYSNNGSTTTSTIDWGDGTVQSLVEANGVHTYEVGTGHNTENSEQWIITITFGTSIETESLFGLGKSATMRIVAMKIGNTKYCGTTYISCDHSVLQYVKIRKGENFNWYFQGAYYLSKVELSDDITKLPDYVFRSCNCLFDINLSNITDVGNYAFTDCYNLNHQMPNLKSIGNYAFKNCSKLSDIDFSNLTSIGNYAFNGCYSIEKITLPDSITYIPDNAFQNCYSLKTVNISDSVKSIGNYAFQRCPLENISGEYVESIGNSAFQNCAQLKSVKMPQCNSVGSYAFDNKCLTDITLAAGATLADNAISSDCKLVKITYV